MLYVKYKIAQQTLVFDIQHKFLIILIYFQIGKE